MEREKGKTQADRMEEDKERGRALKRDEKRGAVLSGHTGCPLLQ